MRTRLGLTHSLLNLDEEVLITVKEDSTEKKRRDQAMVDDKAQGPLQRPPGRPAPLPLIAALMTAADLMTSCVNVGNHRDERERKKERGQRGGELVTSLFSGSLSHFLSKLMRLECKSFVGMSECVVS